MNRSVIAVSFGGTAIVVGITILLLQPSNNIGRIWGGIIALLGLIACMWSYTQVLIDDRRELDRREKESNYLANISSGIASMNNRLDRVIEQIDDAKQSNNKET